MKNSDMPAMPLDSTAESDIEQGYKYNHTGLTKLEHFAGLAMQASLINDQEANLGADSIAKCAVACAQALLDELEKQK